MVKFSQADVAKLGLLARISISEATAQALAPQLKQILEHTARLQRIDTKDVLPTSQVTGLKDVWREDQVRPTTLSRDELLQNAPATQDGYIKVRRVL